MLVGIVVHYTLLYIIGGIMGAPLLMLFNGPPPQFSRYILVIGVHCNILFFGIVYRPPCPVLGCAVPFSGGTTVGVGARTKHGAMERGEGVKESP